MHTCMHAITKVVLHTTTRKLCMSIMDYLVYGKIGLVYLHIDSNGEDQICHVLLCGACPGNAQNNTLEANLYMRTTSAKAYYFSSKYQGL